MYEHEVDRLDDKSGQSQEEESCVRNITSAVSAAVSRRPISRSAAGAIGAKVSSAIRRKRQPRGRGRVPASAGKAKAGMVHSVSVSVQVKLCEKAFHT